MTSPLIFGGATAGVTLPGLAAGTHSLTAIYSGDAHYAPAGLAPQPVTVSPERVSVRIDCDGIRSKGQFVYDTSVTVRGPAGPPPPGILSRSE